MRQSRFDRTYNLIMESLASDVVGGAKTGALVGTIGGSTVGAVGGGVFGAVAGGAAGAVLGLPIGMISGAAKWLANKDAEKVEEETDRTLVQTIIDKINNKQATQEDANKLKELENKYHFEALDKAS